MNNELRKAQAIFDGPAAGWTTVGSGLSLWYVKLYTEIDTEGLDDSIDFYIVALRGSSIPNVVVQDGYVLGYSTDELAARV